MTKLKLEYLKSGFSAKKTAVKIDKKYFALLEFDFFRVHLKFDFIRLLLFKYNLPYNRFCYTRFP